MKTKDDITRSFKSSIAEFSDWFESQPNEYFSKGPLDKWDSSQHLDHIVKTHGQLNAAYRIPKILLGARFGKSKRDSLSYEQIVETYLDKLQYLKGPPPGMTSERFTAEQKGELLSKLNYKSRSLAEAFNKWSDRDLDAYVLPHPLIGKLQLREMMMWNTHHIRHHLKNLVDNYSFFPS